MSQEKLQILNMVKEGKISADEGVKLLDALENNENDSGINPRKGKHFRIRVLVPDEETKVNVTLPISLLKVGVKIASKFSPELKEAGLSEDTLEDILKSIDSEEIGKIVEVDTEDGTKVEITVE